MGIEGWHKRRDVQMEKGLRRIPLGTVLDTLQAEALEHGPTSISETPRIYALDRSITPKELESMAMLDFECLLTDTDGDLLLETGDAMTVRSGRYDSEDVPPITGVIADEMTAARRNRSRFSLHNHPAMPFIMTAGQWVSPDDHDVSRYMSSDIDIIVVRDGIIGHKYKEDTHFLPWLRDGVKREHQPKRFNAAMVTMALQGTDRTIREQKASGVMDFFIPFRGDEDSERKLTILCDYMNDAGARWEDIRAEIERE